MAITDDDLRQRRAAEFRRLIERLWGYGAQTRAARHFEVTGRTVRNWVSARSDIPDQVIDEARAMVNIAPPPDSSHTEDRDGACAAALEPALTELRDRAVAAGWNPAEVAVAILSLTASEIRAIAGRQAMIRLLDELRAAVDAGGDG